MSWKYLAGAGGLFLAAAVLRDRTVGRVRKAIYCWLPGEGEPKEEVGDWEEREFREDLADHLEEEIDSIRIIEEDGKGRGRRDIWIRNPSTDGRVCIELKFGPYEASETKRLLGQLLRYGDDVDAVFVVLLDPDPNQETELREGIEGIEFRERIEVIPFSSNG